MSTLKPTQAYFRHGQWIQRNQRVGWINIHVARWVDKQKGKIKESTTTTKKELNARISQHFQLITPDVNDLNFLANRHKLAEWSKNRNQQSPAFKKL